MSVDNTSVRLIPTYHSDIAEMLFVGTDYWSQRDRTDLSEMIARLNEEGIHVTHDSLLQRLEAFVPERVLGAGPDWKERLIAEWLGLERPRIRKVLIDHFHGGGAEARVREQQRLLLALVDIGVNIEGLDRLRMALLAPCDWRYRLIRYAVKGREKGVRFVFDGSPTMVRRVDETMRQAGFAEAEIREFLGCAR
ncbi:hypothetical protein [Paraburkholderia sp. SIMBA_054]|uniref:hypothetical protein n=1 Tax=Paraburkholderia sp. SIMBA_054 TaxID=3085795 RepID=UPI00397AC715